MEKEASVIVTAFDRKESLVNLIRGLNEQTIPQSDFELIIADDSSRVNIAEQVLDLITPLCDFSVVKTNLPYEVNGVSKARNLGITASKARTIISIDDDCIPNKYLIEEHLSHHHSNNPVIVLGHRSERFNKLMEKRPISVTETKALYELMGGFTDQLNFFNFMTGNISFPRHILDETGLFNEEFAQPGEHGWEDIELGYRLWRSGYRTLFARNALVYRPPTEKEKEEKRDAMDATRKACDRFLKMHPLIPWIQQFFEALEKKRFDIVKDVGSRILKKDPGNHGILREAGSMRLLEKNYNGALEYFYKALDINPYHPMVYEKLGEIFFHTNQYNAAHEFFQKALELDHNRTRSLYFMVLLNDKPLRDKKPARFSRNIHLELGGGLLPTKIRAENQDDFINMDILNLPTVDVKTDFNAPLSLPDNSISKIFSREVIEHLEPAALRKLLEECFRILRQGGSMILCCPDFEAIMNLFDKKCSCVVDGNADPFCTFCHGNALISEEYWRSNLFGNRQDYGDGGIHDTHKNEITFTMMKNLLTQIGFKDILRNNTNPFYEEHKRIIKLSITCIKP